MSATRDKSQKIAFVYTNLYTLFKKGKEAALNAEGSPSSPLSPHASQGFTSGKVLKAESLANSQPMAAIRVSPYTPVELLGNRLQKPAQAQERNIVRKPAVLAQAQQNPAIETLKQNIKDLNDLHSRLRFMLKELEDLVKE